MKEEIYEFCKRLGIEYKAEMEPFYKEGKILLNENGTLITNIQRITELNNKYNFFRKWLCDVCRAASIVEKDDDLLLFTYVLYAMIKKDSPLVEMEMPDRGRMDTDFAPLFSILFCFEDMISNMEKRGLPHEVISDTLQGIEAEFNDYYDDTGRSGMRTLVPWYMLFVKGNILRIGRLSFEKNLF